MDRLGTIYRKQKPEYNQSKLFKATKRKVPLPKKTTFQTNAIMSHLKYKTFNLPLTSNFVQF